MGTLVHRDLFPAGADQLGDLGHAKIQPHPGEIFQSQVVRSGVRQPFGDHAVECEQGAGRTPFRASMMKS